MATIYAPDTTFSGDVMGVTFTAGTATTTDEWLIAQFTKLGYGIGTPAAARNTGVPFRLEASGVADVTGVLEVNTGLTTVTSAEATLNDYAALTGTEVTVTIPDQTTSPGVIFLYVWKPTASGDVTPIASVTETAVSWAAQGN
jgi:hypothetical protein